MNSYEKRIALVTSYLERLALDRDITDYYRGRSIMKNNGTARICGPGE